jgi:anhydro-N-acetylmuramic acid kinase
MTAPGGLDRGASELYVGLMTGTSMDGVDAVLADCEAKPPRVIAHDHRPLPVGLRADLLALNTSGVDEIHRSSAAALELAHLYAASVQALLAASGMQADAIRAIGAHGQTVRHRPDLGYTVQLNAPATLAELTGIDVVADLRSRDIAAGGQGAPLVPAFHRLAFASEDARAVVNIGGISNITALCASATLGFDAGPGNVLIDAWTSAHFGVPFDADGHLAASSEPDQALLADLLDEPYFAMPPPKSTGRDLFTLEWLQAHPRTSRLEPKAVLATLTALTARVIGNAVDRWLPGAKDVIVCGGGARNATLIALLQESCVPRPVTASDRHGIPADQVEALAFAWLAQCHVHRVAASLPSATGAAGARILGALYPGRR